MANGKFFTLNNFRYRLSSVIAVGDVNKYEDCVITKYAFYIILSGYSEEVLISYSDEAICIATRNELMKALEGEMS